MINLSFVLFNFYNSYNTCYLWSIKAVISIYSSHKNNLIGFECVSVMSYQYLDSHSNMIIALIAFIIINELFFIMIWFTPE